MIDRDPINHKQKYDFIEFNRYFAPYSIPARPPYAEIRKA